MRWSIAAILVPAACSDGDDPPPDGADPIQNTVGVDGTDAVPDDDTDADPTVLPACRVASSSGVRVSDGGVLFEYTYRYDADGLLTEVLRDHVPIDGVTDAVTTFTYDAAGRKLTDELDEGDDGSVDSRKTWTYDAAGLPVLLEVDTDADGGSESTYSYSHDPNGALLTETFETSFPVADWEDTLQYDQATLVRRRRDNGIDGSTDELTDYTYDPDGTVLEEATTDPDDGSALRTVSRTTDGAGHVLTLLFEDFVDGSALRLTYTYDAAGNVVIVERDPRADGTASTVTTYVWECP